MLVETNLFKSRDSQEVWKYRSLFLSLAVGNIHMEKYLITFQLLPDLKKSQNKNTLFILI